VPEALSTSLDGLFDDAGLFPPARRPMADALAVHARVRSGPHRRLVGPFLCPVGRLEELDACVASGVPAAPRVGLVVYPGDESAALRAVHRSDVVQVEAPVEVTLPAAAFQRTCFLELPPRSDPATAVDQATARGAGVKVRCGGPTPDVVPSAGWLAAVLHRTAGIGSRAKATAGLHQPFYTEEAGHSRHGFINLLAAAGAAVQGAEIDELATLLAAPPTDDAMLVARVDRRARDLLASIGTCSLDEPLDALADLGLGG
jgi:hypothetical protein